MRVATAVLGCRVVDKAPFSARMLCVDDDAATQILAELKLPLPEHGHLDGYAFGGRTLVERHSGRPSPETE
jgi:hypothetical protein